MKLTAFLSVLALFAAPVNAATIHVPADQPTIQAGIDAAVNGDTVLVACDTYNKHYITMKHEVYLGSETGQSNCVIIDADTPIGRILVESLDSITSIDGFTVTAKIVTGFYNDILGGWIYSSEFSSSNNNYVIFANSSPYDKELIVTSIATLDTVFAGKASVVSSAAWAGSRFLKESTRNMAWANDPQLSLQPGWPIQTENYHFPGSGIYADIDQDFPGLEIAFAVYGTRPGFPLVDWTKLYVRHQDGTPVSGFDPYVYIEQPTQMVSIHDIDNDNQMEFILLTGNEVETGGQPPMLHVIEHTGDYKAGYPIIVAPRNTGAGGSWPVIADLNNDGIYEIIVTTNSGPEFKLHVFNPDGSYFDPDGSNSWPLTLAGNLGMPAVANLDGDPELEIVFGEAPMKVNVYSFDGTLEKQLTVDTLTSAFTPSIGDVDYDTQLEIVVGAGRAAHPGKIYVFSHDGELKNSWTVPCAFPNTVSLGDIDEDFDGLEIITAAGINCPYIDAFHWDGTPLEQWPVVTQNNLDNPVALADLDNDLQQEILVPNGHDGGTPHLFIKRLDGTDFYGSPIELISRSEGATIGNIDSDPALEIIQSNGNDLTIYEYTSSSGYPYPLAGGVIEWPMAGANAQHTGLYSKLGDPCTNTEPGTVVVVDPVDSVSITFDSVSQSGCTQVVFYTTGPGSPDGFSIIPENPPLYYHITTTAIFEGQVKVCLEYNATCISSEDSLTLHHWDGSEWVDITSSLDTTANIICGLTTSLSPFVLAIPSCCVNRGNADGDGGVNVADLTYLVDFLFFGGDTPPCPEEGNVDADGGINIADVTYLVEYIFFGGDPPPPCP